MKERDTSKAITGRPPFAQFSSQKVKWRAQDFSLFTQNCFLQSLLKTFDGERISRDREEEETEIEENKEVENERE